MAINVPASIEELNWHKWQARETRFHAAQDAARARREQAAEILQSFTISRDDANCRQDGYGVPSQMALRFSRGPVAFSVVCKIDDAGDFLWFVTDTSRVTPDAQTLILACQMRIEKNRRFK